MLHNYRILFDICLSWMLFEVYLRAHSPLPKFGASGHCGRSLHFLVRVEITTRITFLEEKRLKHSVDGAAATR
ncbi:hypothetical protein ACHAWF_007378 [Thalassiosira exigua]